MRVTGYEKFRFAQENFNKIQLDMAEKYEQVTTGKLFKRVSDDPVRVNRSMLINTSLSKLDQYIDNVSDAKSLLSNIDSIYSQSMDTIERVKELANKGGTGTVTEADRKVMAAEVDKMIDQMLSFSNTKFLDRYMYSGEKTDTKPVEYDGFTFVYNGTQKEMEINVSENLSVTVSQRADEVYIPVMEEMVKLREALKSSDQEAISEAMGGLEKASNNFIDKRSEMGAQLKSVELMNQAMVETKNDLTAKKMDTEDVNLADAISEFSYLQTLYQASSRSSAIMLRTTIMDYI